MSTAIATVLFACIHNAGRSQMAAAWFDHLADPAKARAVSAGTEPGTRVHPEVVEAMNEVGIDLSNGKPQFLSDDLAAASSLLVTMGCGEACPHVPGLRRADWPLEDPKGKPIERVREIRDDVKARVVKLLEQESWKIMVDLRNAIPSDLEAVRSLLRDAGLPTEGVEDQFPAQYKLATVERSVVGVAGLELHGRAGLFRSLAVRSAFRGTGVGTKLVRERIERARAQGLSEIFLLTTTASSYFEKLGFRRTDRETAPAELAKSREFASVCPGSAVCLVWQA